MTDEEKDSGHVWLIKKLREAWEERDQHKKAEEIHVKVRLKLQAENEKLKGELEGSEKAFKECWIRAKYYQDENEKLKTENMLLQGDWKKELQSENEKLEGRVLELVEENTKLMEEVVELEAELENKGGLSASEELEVLERLEKLEAALEGR